MPPAPAGNKNARKGEESMDSKIVVRVTRQEKGAWIRASRPGGLADWIRRILNRAADDADQSGDQSGGRYS